MVQGPVLRRQMAVQGRPPAASVMRTRERPSRSAALSGPGRPTHPHSAPTPTMRPPAGVMPRSVVTSIVVRWSGRTFG